MASPTLANPSGLLSPGESTYIAKPTDIGLVFIFDCQRVYHDSCGGYSPACDSWIQHRTYERKSITYWRL